MTQPLKPASPYRRDRLRQNHAAALMTLELVLAGQSYPQECGSHVERHPIVSS